MEIWSPQSSRVLCNEVAKDSYCHARMSSSVQPVPTATLPCPVQCSSLPMGHSIPPTDATRMTKFAIVSSICCSPGSSSG